MPRVLFSPGSRYTLKLPTTRVHGKTQSSGDKLVPDRPCASVAAHCCEGKEKTKTEVGRPPFCLVGNDLLCRCSALACRFFMSKSFREVGTIAYSFTDEMETQGGCDHPAKVTKPVPRQSQACPTPGPGHTMPDWLNQCHDSRPHGSPPGAMPGESGQAV